MPLGDFVGLLMLLLQGKITISLNMETWNLLFYRLKKKNIAGKPAFFEKMQFDWDGPYPKSPELSHYLNCLSMFGVLVTTSPRFQEYKLDEKHTPILKKKYEALDETAKLFLDHAVKIAMEEFTKRAK